MFDLSAFAVKDMTACGAALRKLGSGAGSMEEVAGRVVRYLYDHLIDGQTGGNACALVRFYRTHPYGDLGADLQHFADAVFGRRIESPEVKCLILLASAGEKLEWNSRTNSAGHRAIPLASEQMVVQFPMVSQLIHQFGLEVHTVLKPDPAMLVEQEQKTYNVFIVPNAEGSPYVPAQEDFVIPFGIRSVVGFGGLLPTGNLFAIIMFSKVPVSRDTADLFKPVAMNVKVAVLPFDGRAIFA